MYKTEKILVPTDFSEYSEKALKKAVDIAETFNSEIFLLHVIPDEVGISMAYLDSETQKELNERMEKESMKEMKKQAEKVLNGKNLKVNYSVKKGVPYHEILNYEAEAGTDLLVIASHSKSFIEEAFFGSTTEKVVRRSNCSVFVVRD